MKRSKMMRIIINYIYHDNIYLMSPIVDWNLLDVLNKNIRNNYEKIKPILLEWQEKGYINLIENDDIVFSFIPEKLPTKEQLMNESWNFKD